MHDSHSVAPLMESKSYLQQVHFWSLAVFTYLNWHDLQRPQGSSTVTILSHPHRQRVSSSCSSHVHLRLGTQLRSSQGARERWQSMHFGCSQVSVICQKVKRVRTWGAQSACRAFPLMISMVPFHFNFFSISIQSTPMVPLDKTKKAFLFLLFLFCIFYGL